MLFALKTLMMYIVKINQFKKLLNDRSRSNAATARQNIYKKRNYILNFSCTQIEFEHVRVMTL